MAGRHPVIRSVATVAGICGDVGAANDAASLERRLEHLGVRGMGNLENASRGATEIVKSVYDSPDSLTRL